jgi:RNA polymerase sigma-70 factor (ECF subfamily)
MRTELCDEAIRLARLLLSLMPDEAEVLALLALLLFNDSRRAARTHPAGELRTLEEQDRSLWDRAGIDEGSRLLETSLRRHRRGPFQVLAAIAALHAEARRPEDTDWRQIVLLYDQLLGFQRDPVVELNRAVAVAMATTPEEGLHLLDALDAEGALPQYHLLPAARADLLRRAGRPAEAAAAYREAINLCSNPVEQRYLARRLSEVSGRPDQLVRPSD